MAITKKNFWTITTAIIFGVAVSYLTATAKVGGWLLPFAGHLQTCGFGFPFKFSPGVPGTSPDFPGLIADCFAAFDVWSFIVNTIFWAAIFVAVIKIFASRKPASSGQ